MIKVFRLPDLGEGLTESEIVAWRVSPGDTVELNQLIADVETAKAVVELPSPFAGVVTQLHQQPGTVVHVGEPIVSFEVAGAEPAEPAGATPGQTDAAAPAEPAEEREAVLVGYGAAPERSGRPHRRARTGAAAAGMPAAVAPASAEPAVVEPTAAESPTVEPPAVEPSEPAAARPRSTPPVRALARVLGVDLSHLTGTGPTGLITREDVRAQLARPAEAPDGTETGAAAPAPGPGQRETRRPIRSVRKHTAAAMVRSAFTAPHVTEFLTIDVTPTMELIDALKTNRSFQGVRIGILAVVAKALCLAVARNPDLNTRWDEATGEIVQFHHVNLGIAAATPRGLLVPNIPDADRLGLADLAAALAELTEAARAGTTSAASLRGGTISITNVGVFGIDAGTPILNPGEAAILAVGGIRRQPWEHDGGIALRQVMTLSLSFDHRLVDGEQGARFLVDIGTILSDPAMVLTMV
ncbi:2-oxoisovalerate dehydrogenase E2 component (dihydrolipoyl transacylase) [Cryobacterium sp. MP_M5]|uniref:dihydrolipoamide acetyltransferase family protein n=1 Tax=unclassified Cryobacterium TaxID=2649013 RepID=UPI0018C9B5DE|nr:MULTISPECIES: dihydrolipoamide acetyltransferase family protein [unclassified Cryobacterium]MBG6057429.1 pyruvate dehydrogenase E2 component (dihydrolipoamide acetyltransferase) [Cryobacterium sp. MP_M3]MEC5175628.1 2-oxoisovalerate dehydrogenase E2 component (dihydrolipoyl transacylase) [Cryobacterium sp. MP_M5]